MLRPERSRPVIDASYGVATDAESMLPWSWAVERLSRATMYWIATARPNALPHLKPIWGVWVQEQLYLETGPVSRAGRNLARNPAVAVHVQEGEDVVILEGVMMEAPIPPPGLAAAIAEAFGAKYGSRGYQPSPDQYLQSGSGLYLVRPRLVFAWSDFVVDATRWILKES